MATAEESRQVDAPMDQNDDLMKETVQIDGLKRKASVDEPSDSPKRTRLNDDEAAADRRSRRDSLTSVPVSRDEPPQSSHDRRQLATQEEKKRGKRLFGGLLSTLSQTAGNSQHKRRQEIERRQQERLQKQQVEDGQKRDERLSRLRDIRMAEQITFDEEVMRNKHSKMLAMARYLRTRSRPHIYYQPWKLTADQEGEIGDQIRKAKATIEEERELFKEQRAKHIRSFGESKRVLSEPEPDQPETHVEKTAGKQSHEVEMSEQPEKVTYKDRKQSQEAEERSEQSEKATDKEHPHSHHHDESADVLEDADEDMVIY